MPASQLTPEQYRAITTRDVSVALSAGAGCGKTHVLTERFLSHLELKTGADSAKPARLHQLIAITFTDAAAREMRTRIRNACRDRLNDHSLSKQAADEWLRLLRLIETARISTIHSFCTSLLRQHAVAARLDPAFGVLDQGDADVLLSEVIDDVLRERLAQSDDKTLDLAAAFGLSRLKEQLYLLVRQRRAADIAAWLSQPADDVAATWREFYARQALPAAIGQIAEDTSIGQILALLDNSEVDFAIKPKFAEARCCLLELLPQLRSRAVNGDQLTTIRKTAGVQGICNAKDWPSKALYDEYTKACKSLRETIDKCRPAPFDDEAALATARLGLDLLRLADGVARAYSNRKMALGQLDFDDLLTQAHALLTHPENAALRKEISGEVRLVLVDEFQDTDQLQVDLIKTLCGAGFDEGRLFFVGDFKQSIYRFRGAQPNVFHELQAALDKRGRLPLTVNFRTQPAILHFVNALFCDAFGKDYEALQPHREQKTAVPAVEFLWTLAPEKNSRIKGMADAARREEALRIACRLRELVDNRQGEMPIVDKDTSHPRSVRPGDIAILFRALSDVQLYEEALRAYELDYYLVGGHAFYSQQEVFDVLNLLRAVASPADEISLAGALRSPLFALEDETLFWLVEAGGALNVGLFAEQLPNDLSDTERAKVIRAAGTLRHLRAIKDQVAIAELLAEAISRTGYDAVLLAEFLGQRKLANLQKIVERARAADQGGTLALDGFITQLAQFISQQPKEALAATAAETADVIRLMTIHQAKGLEFPLVVVPDLDRPPKHGRPVAALDSKLGPLVPYPNDDGKEPATGMSLFAAQERNAELDERKRLLYVACTRAADYLILSSSLESCAAPKSDWMKLIAARFDLASGEIVRELPAKYKTPQIRVTLAGRPADPSPAGKTRGPDILELLDDTHQLAEAGQGIEPPHVGPIAPDRAARRQFSFSRLTGQLIRPLDIAGADSDRESAFDSEPAPRQSEIGGGVASPIDPRGLGRLVHDVLARINFADRDGGGSIRSWCEHLAPLHVQQGEAEAADLACEMIERLVASPRGRQLVRAAAFHRELEFLLAWPEESREQGAGSREHDGKSAPNSSQLPAPSSLHLRGYIDCLYQDGEGGWHLADYKTNDVSAADCPRVARQYEMQLYVYAIAAERALGVPPVELALHFLRPGVEHVFPWNEDARRRAVEMVNNAIHTMIKEECVASRRPAEAGGVAK
jgi:ATP-dependent helicase/nuclease subunit A